MRSAHQLIDRIIEGTQAGEIILMHVMYQSRQISRDALPGIIDGLRAKGFEFAIVSALFSSN